MSICLTLGITVLDSTIEIQLVFPTQCTVGAPLLSAKASTYLRIALVFLKTLYI